MSHKLRASPPTIRVQRKQQLEFRLRLGRPSLAFLWDHRVGGAAIMPGAAYFEAAVAAARTLAKLPEPAVALTEAAIAAPLKLPPPAEASSVVLSVEVALATGAITIRSAPADAKPAAKGAADRSTLHLKGSLVCYAAAAAVDQQEQQSERPTGGHVPSAELARAGCTEPQATAGVYSRLLSAGLQYGPEFRLLRSIQRGASGAAGWLRAAGRDAPVSGFLLHPALLDNALQLGAVVPEEAAAAGADASDDAAFVPAGLAVYAVASPLQQGSAVLAQARRAAGRGAAQAAGSATYRDHAVLSGSGAVLAVLDGLEAKRLHGSGSEARRAAAAAAQPELLYEVAWLTADAAPATAAEADGSAAALSLRAGSSALAAASAALATLQGAMAQEVASVQLQTAAVQQHGAAPGGSAAASSAATAAPVWGMLRSFAQEAPAVAHGGQQADAFGLLQPSGDAASIALGGRPAGSPSDGYGAVLRGGTAARAALLPSRRVRPAPGPYHLMPRPRGAFSSLVPEPVAVGTAKPGWVEVQVQAVGINFRCGWGKGRVYCTCCECSVAA